MVMVMVKTYGAGWAMVIAILQVRWRTLEPLVISLVERIGVALRMYTPSPYLMCILAMAPRPLMNVAICRSLEA
jgi:hypothetical protein